MKKAFGIAALLLAFVACNKVETGIQPAENTEGIPFTATVSLGDNAATKALAENYGTLAATWAEGEKVALIHNGVSDEMEVTSVSGGSATITGTITGSPADGDPVTIIYPSSAADGTTGNIKADLLYAQNGLLTGEGSISERFEARKGTGTLKVDGTATLSGSVSLTNQFAIFKFFIENAANGTALSAKPLTITIGEQDYVITPAEATDELYAALPAVSEQKVSFDATDGSNKTYTCAKLSVSFEAGKYYQSTLKMREYVLIGKHKWATMNVGANAPDELGDYFAWGETSTKEIYNWTTYSHIDTKGNTVAESDKWEYINKYQKNDGQHDGKWYDASNNFVGDGMTTLESVDDAATVNWGGGWRMPNPDEFERLFWSTNTVTAWTSSGVTLTSKEDSSKSIYLPCTGGFRTAGGSFDTSYAYYWTSSLSKNTHAAMHHKIGNGQSSATSDRYRGMLVRPICD